jgi:hypothetical protein
VHNLNFARALRGIVFQSVSPAKKKRSVFVTQNSSCHSGENDDDNVMPQFERYIGIDYAGAKTPTDSLPGLRMHAADWVLSPREVPPPPSPRKYWTRRGLAEWLAAELSGG